MSTQKPAQVAAERASLGLDLAKRFKDRDKPRSQKMEEVDKKGVFGAAGTPAAIRRTAHMTLAEGRTLTAPPVPPIVTARETESRGGRREASAERTMEAVVGGLDDSDHVNFLARGVRAARAVCRLVQDGQAIGTGFLVAPGLILTNNHVISTGEEAAEFTAEFDYELDVEDQPRRPVVRFSLDPERVFVTSDARKGLDFTFIAISPTSQDGSEQIVTFGWLPMDERKDKILEGEPAVIIQHPRGDPKRLCLFAAELVDRPTDYIHYTTDTDGGSSGSPVLNRGWLLLGLHHAATTTDRARRGHPIVVNEGIRVSSIINALRTETQATSGDMAKALAAVTRPEVIANGRPQSPLLPALAAPPHFRESGRNGFSLGTVGNGHPSSRFAPSLFEKTTIRKRDRAHFDSRDPAHQGYKARFLGNGALVPLPGMPAWMREDTARLRGSGDETELTYTHFSVVQCASRRLAYFTAVNIDGALMQRRGREDRDYEAADKWYFDPRIEENLHLGPEVYDGTPFDFGHMVRREDPVWGDDRTSIMANDDTFYMTNCAPQHSTLNQRTWLRLENAILKTAREHGVKVSVLTGPILSPQDPTVRDVQVPTAFWKIVAYRSNGRLRAHGFMQWQTELVDEVRARFEGFGELEPAAEYQVAIRDIARDSSLDFGPLVAADDEDLVAGAGHESRGRRRRRLSDRVIESLADRIAAARTSSGDTVFPYETDSEPTGSESDGNSTARARRDGAKDDDPTSIIFDQFQKSLLELVARTDQRLEAGRTAVR